MVQYVSGGYVLIDAPVERSRGILMLLPGQSEDGYGSKITTDHMLKFYGEGRKYRVYATCYGNAASHWIMKGGKKLYI